MKENLLTSFLELECPWCNAYRKLDKDKILLTIENSPESFLSCRNCNHKIYAKDVWFWLVNSAPAVGEKFKKIKEYFEITKIN